MTIFVVGVHGVGKTFLAKPAALRPGMKYATVSQLIREQRGFASWDASKKVDEVALNQIALLAAVSRIKSGGQLLLLDGHFVLRKAVGDHVRLPQTVFRNLGCTAVVLLVCSTKVVLDRLCARGDDSWSEAEIDLFAFAEADHATSDCDALDIPLITLREPTSEVVESALCTLAVN